MTGLKSIVLVPLKEVLVRVGNFIPTLAGVIIILIGGWLVAKLVQKVAVKVLETLKLDVASEKARIHSLLSKGGIDYSLSELIGVLLYWLIMLIVIMAAVNALGLTVTAALLNSIIAYMPNVIAAVFILVLGIFFANLLESVIRTVANNAGIAQAKLLGQVAQTIIVVFAVVAALEQLGIAVRVIAFTLQALIVGVALGGALAFGLGCKDMAAKTMKDLLDKFK